MRARLDHRRLPVFLVSVLLGCAGVSGARSAVSPCTVAGSCLRRLTLPGSSHQLPYYASYPIDVPNPAITAVVVFNEGANRMAHAEFQTMVAAARRANQLASTLIVTPYFQALVSARGSTCRGHVDTPLPNDLVWTCNAWPDGSAAANDAGATSFGALDALLAVILETFPQLRRVTVAGFSAGGQLTQRYAAVNAVDRGAVPFRYVVGSPSSYLYLDTRRPLDAANCTAAGCPDGFAPFGGAGSCPEYNHWKYGTQSLAGAAGARTPAQITQAYLSRRVTYLLGELDNGPTTAADYGQLDRSCAGEAQGPYRLQRGLAFYAYVTTQLSGVGPSKLVTAPGCAHSARCVFQSAAGIEAVFGN